MLNKILLLSVIFIIIATASIFGVPLEMIYGYASIRERVFEMPLPDVQYELPEALIGEFIMLSNIYNHQVIIFPNNKFIAITDSSGYLTAYSYGYIVRNNDTWYFSPLSNEGYIRSLTEIFLSDSGFSYYLPHGRLLISMRKENMPIPEHLAEEITIPNRIPSRQYFIFNTPQGIMFDYNEIDEDPWGGDNFWTYRLRIDNGIVRIFLVGSIPGGGPITFEGFMEITEENNDAIRGVIRFTNGIPYFYINDGTADIEINSNGSIIITMLYTFDPEVLSSNQIIQSNKLQFPARLVLEY